MNSYPFLGRRTLLSSIIAVAVAVGSQVSAGVNAKNLTYRITDLGTFGDSGGMIPSGGVNASGKAAFTSNLDGTGNWETHAFIYSRGVKTDLGSFGGGYSYAGAINNAGQVVGFATTAYTNYAFLYSKGALINLGSLGGEYSWATGINALGQVIGQSANAYGSEHAFLYSKGLMQDLGSFDGDGSTARDLNNSAQVVGESWVKVGEDGYVTRAFLYSNGILTNLGTLGGEKYSYSSATKINEAGQVIGWSTTSSGMNHGFLYSSGTMKDLGTLGGAESYAQIINNAGQIAGWSYIEGDAEMHAFLYSNGKMNDLGISSDGTPLSMNSSGQVVGSTGGQAFIYSDGVTRVLDDLIIPTANIAWIQSAFAINDSGEILAMGYDSDGQQHNCLLTPVADGGQKAKP